MKTKRLALFAITLFALVFVMTFASAVITLNPTSYSATIANGDTGSFTFTIFNDGGTGNQAVVNITTSVSNLVSGANSISNSQISISGIPDTIQPNSTSSSITVDLDIPSDQIAGTYTGTITVNGVNNNTGASVASKTITLSIIVTSSDPSEITDCLSTGNPGDIEIRHIDFTNNGVEGTTFGKSSTWYPFENITADIQVRNNGNDRVNNIEVNWGIWDKDNKEWVIEPDNFKEFDLKDGKTQDLTADFKIDDRMDVDLSDLDDGNHYAFYVYAIGEVDNDTAPTTCGYDYKNADIAIDSDLVILNNIQIPDTVQCGQNIQITADAWNIGDRDQDDVTVRLFGRESALNVNNLIANVGSIDAFDKKPVTFSFTVPQGIDQKYYSLDFQVYDDNGDIFQTSDDDNSEFIVPFQVSGCSSASQIGILASILSGGQAGKQLQVSTLITNNANTAKTYSVAASGYSGWASSATLDQSNLVLNPGQSATVIFTFNVNKDVEGSQTFTINLLSGTDTITQPVAVTIQPAPGFLGITGDTISGNAWIWGIGILNLILVIIIIIVAVRIARR